MSRNSKRRRQEKQQKQRRRERAQRAQGANRPPRWIDVCQRAAELMERGQWSEAREILETYDQAHAGQPDVLGLLIDVYHEQRDYDPYVRICRRLLEQQPDNRSLHLMLAAGYLSADRPASALLAFRRFVERWPDDPLGEGVRDELAQLQQAVDALLRETPFPEAERLECAALHEEVLDSLAAGDYERAIRVGELLLTRSPDFVSAMNNVAEASFQLGQAEKALDLSRRALQRCPDNVHALSNLTRFLFLTGSHGEAQELADRLRVVKAEDDEQYCKICEALSFLGDDQGVLAAFAEAVRRGAGKRSTSTTALLHHLAAVALARSGDDRQARRLWNKALKIRPGLELAAENLAGAAEPVALRQGPWCFPINYWIPSGAIEELRHSVDRRDRGKRADAALQGIEHFAQAHPEVVGLVPALLDRGDPVGRDFARRLALVLETPELLTALRAFCLSQRGPDAMRLEIANRLGQIGALPSGPVRMWLNGGWQDIELLGFEVTTEPVGACHSPPVEQWAYEGLQALRGGDAVKAEALFQKCIARDGETPDLLNNLAACYGQQGRVDDMRWLIREVHERWPDYFFGQVAMANMATKAGDLERAQSYLDPLRRQKQFHISEFSALAAAYIHMFVRRGNREAARSWLAMWRQFDPDHPELATYERYYSGGFFEKLRKRLSRPKQ